MSSYDRIRSKLLAKVNGWMDDVDKDKAEEMKETPKSVGEQEEVTKNKNKKSLPWLAEISRKIKKAPTRADKIMQLAAKKAIVEEKVIEEEITEEVNHELEEVVSDGGAGTFNRWYWKS